MKFHTMKKKNIPEVELIGSITKSQTNTERSGTITRRSTDRKSIKKSENSLYTNTSTTNHDKHIPKYTEKDVDHSFRRIAHKNSTSESNTYKETK